MRWFVSFRELTRQRWRKRAIPCAHRRFSVSLVALMCVYGYFCIRFSKVQGNQ
nr:MAG TPA: hypothetical protein [Caudoviricetes sp.]